MNKVLLVKPDDNVATCLAAMQAGQEVNVTAGELNATLTLRDAVPFGHKFAVRDIGRGEPVIKYAETIGVASTDIAAGDWVHVHNVESVRARGDRAGAAGQ